MVLARNTFTFTFYQAVLRNCPKFTVFRVIILKSYE